MFLFFFPWRSDDDVVVFCLVVRTVPFDNNVIGYHIIMRSANPKGSSLVDITRKQGHHLEVRA